MSEYLFTYGTLRLEQSHPMADFLSKNSVLVGLGEISNAKLFRIDWYPALIETDNEQDKVYGDVFNVNDIDVLKKIDEYEGIGIGNAPYEYRRVKIKTKTELKDIEAWVYFYNIPLPEHATIIESGDFLNP
jgi:gamma-glutamylcyclotransferase (GGCT)/AIG2-like uncharacterized protein YtfP